MNNIEEMSPDVLREAIRDEARPLVVDFWSPWCAPCRTLRPHIERLALTSGDAMRFVAVNVEQDSEAMKDFNVRSLPTLALYQGGNETRRLTGAAILPSINALLAAP